VRAIFIQTLSSTVAIGWRGGTSALPSGEALPVRVELTSCSEAGGVTTCGFAAPVTGTIASVSPVLSGGVGVCQVAVHTGDIGGTIAFTGHVENVSFLEEREPRKVDLYLAPLVNQPCPVCTGVALGDAGTCQGGASPGAPCITDHVNPHLGNTSSACLPDPRARFDTITTDAAADVVSTGTHVLASSFPCAGGRLCPCPGQLQPNGCLDGVCQDHGTCDDGSGTIGCFPAPIVSVGSTDPLTLAGAGCASAITPAVKGGVGLPGPVVGSKIVAVSPAP
jgi:hypothetical protein